MRIVVVGGGFVGSATAHVLGRKWPVEILDIKDPEYDPHKTLWHADWVFICVPTPSDAEGRLDVSIVHQEVARCVLAGIPHSRIVVRSTLPPNCGLPQDVVYMPEFLRQARHFQDALNPQRIVTNSEEAYDLMVGCVKTCWGRVICNFEEAVAIKLFSNTYLAMRVAFFNELDGYCKLAGLDERTVIDGVCKDSRIGHHYNTPSSGFGGACLPKDSLQLYQSMADRDAPHALIWAIQRSNKARAEFCLEWHEGTVESEGGLI
jgi:UDPglucose 6-dehydrogenase